MTYIHFFRIIKYSKGVFKDTKKINTYLRDYEYIILYNRFTLLSVIDLNNLSVIFYVHTPFYVSISIDKFK